MFKERQHLYKQMLDEQQQRTPLPVHSDASRTKKTDWDSELFLPLTLTMWTYPSFQTADSSGSSKSIRIVWKRINNLHVYQADRITLLHKQQWFNDNHMMCAHELLKSQFPKYGGLKPTVLKQSKSVKSLPPDSIPILHTHDNAISTIKERTFILAKLVRTSKSVLYVNIANMERQSDCGLFAEKNEIKAELKRI